MIKKFFPALCIFLPLMVMINLPAAEQVKAKDSWQSLLDKRLSNWDKFIGIPEPGVTVPGYPEENRRKQIPIGLNNDPLDIFTMEEGVEFEMTEQEFWELLK